MSTHTSLLSSCQIQTSHGDERASLDLTSKQTLMTILLCVTFTDSQLGTNNWPIFAQVLLPRCDKYPQARNNCRIHQLWERSFTIIISTILRPLKEVPQMVRMTPLRFFALCLLYSSPAQALVASDDHHCQHMCEDNC